MPLLHSIPSSGFLSLRMLRYHRCYRSSDTQPLMTCARHKACWANPWNISACSNETRWHGREKPQLRDVALLGFSIVCSSLGALVLRRPLRRKPGFFGAEEAPGENREPSSSPHPCLKEGRTPPLHLHLRVDGKRAACGMTNGARC